MTNLTELKRELAGVEEKIALCADVLEAAARKVRSGEEWDFDPDEGGFVLWVPMPGVESEKKKAFPDSATIWRLLDIRKQVRNRIQDAETH